MTYQLNASPSDGDTFKYKQYVIQYTDCETKKIDEDLHANEKKNCPIYSWSKSCQAIFLQIQNGAIQLVFLR